MSKISKALDKARQEMQSSFEQQEEISRPQIPIQARFNRKITKIQEPNCKNLESNRIISAFKNQGLLDSYNLLRTQLLSKTKKQGWNTIMVTSASPKEGKTTTAVNLGLSISRDAMQTALVVDANLRAPSLEKILDLQCNQGLTDYLMDGADLSDLLVSPNQDKFVVLPAGRSIVETTDVLGSPRMRELVQELKGRYLDRYIIFDCPHILDMPDSLIFASYVSAILLVVEAGKTPRDQIQRALDTLKDNNVVGLVINKTDAGKLRAYH